MGRGRAKAKQTKVARELKYFSPDTDLSALERELHGASASRYEPGTGTGPADEDAEVDDGPDGTYDRTYRDYGTWAAGER